MNLSQGTTAFAAVEDPWDGWEAVTPYRGQFERIDHAACQYVAKGQ